MQPLEALICAQLRGDRPAWPAEVLLPEFVHTVEFHGVGGLLHLSAPSQWPAEARRELRDLALRRGMWELSHRHAARLALAALEHAGVEPVLIKGTALAYSTYGNASCRARADTDILVRAGAQAAARASLERAGFTWIPSTGGSQATFELAVGAERHAVDMHWTINNSPLIARTLAHASLRKRARPLPAFAASAQAACAVDALLIACLHRLTHIHNPYHFDGAPHHTADRLIWLFDIHLLARTFSEAEWAEVCTLAEERGLRETCLAGLQSAQSRFSTTIPPAVHAHLSRPGVREAPALYFAGSGLRRRLMDVRAAGDWRAKGLYLRDLAFPAREYMRYRFAADSPWSLPWSYLRRAVAGTVRRLSRVIGN